MANRPIFLGLVAQNNDAGRTQFLLSVNLDALSAYGEAKDDLARPGAGAFIDVRGSGRFWITESLDELKTLIAGVLEAASHG